MANFLTPARYRVYRCSKRLGVSASKVDVLQCLWLADKGPFWDVLRQHKPDDWLECNNTIVTDTAVGEAAFRKLNDIESALISVVPSDWGLFSHQCNLAS